LTYLLLTKEPKDPKKAEVVKNFIQYIITDGQASAEGLAYAKLPATLADQDQKLLAEVSANGQTNQASSAHGGK